MEILFSIIAVFVLIFYLTSYNCVMFDKNGFSKLLSRLGDTVAKDEKTKTNSDGDINNEFEPSKYSVAEKWNIIKETRRLWIFAVVVFLLSFAFYIYRQYALIDEPLLNVKYLILLYVYFAVAVIDAHYSIIPNNLILFCLGFWILCCGISIEVDHQSIIALFKYSGYGALFGGGILFVCRVIMKNSMGFGDIKLMAVTGLICGFFKTFNILFYSLLVLFILCVFLLISKKASKHAKIPMGPFLLVGYILAGLFGV